VLSRGPGAEADGIWGKTGSARVQPRLTDGGTMRGMGFNPKAWLVLGAVLALLWLAVERDAGLAGVAVDSIFGWGLVGFALWVVLAQRLAGTAKRMLKGRTHG
jgi:hypothetical protein